MNKLVVPIVPHKLNDLEPLRKVQTLSCGRNIDCLIEIIFFFSVNRSGNIARRIERRAVAFQNKARRHIVCRQVDNGRTVVDFEKSFFAENLNLRGHFVGIKALALITVEVYTEQLICFFVFAEANIDEFAPEFVIFLIAVFELCKFGSCFVFKRLILFRLVMELNVKLNEFIDAALFYLVHTSPFAVSNDEFSELRSPVAEVIYADALIARELMKFFKRMTYYRRSEVSYMEGLCDVRRRVVENDGLSRAE